MTKYIIAGPPVVLKNNKRIVRIGKGSRLISSKKVLKAESGALISLKNQKIEKKMKTLTCPLHFKMTFFGAWKVGAGNLPDLSNLCEAPQDWLQKAEVIADDRQIESLDGTRRVCMCSSCHMRKRYVRGAKAGQMKEDCEAVKKCPFERVEIEIEEYRENESVDIDGNPGLKDLF